SVRRNEHCGRLVERILAAAGDSLLAECHQQLAIFAELVDHVSPTFRHRCVPDGVGYPYVAFGVDEYPVRPGDHTCAEAPDELAGLIEQQYGIDVAFHAKVRAATFRYPDVLAVRSRVHRAGRTPF